MKFSGALSAIAVLGITTLSSLSSIAGEKNSTIAVPDKESKQVMNVFQYPEAGIQMSDMTPGTAGYEAGKLKFVVNQANEINIQAVRFYCNGVEVGTAQSAPFELKWYPSVKGSYYISAVVEGQNGLSAFTNVIKLNISPEHRGVESADMDIFPVPFKDKALVNLHSTWNASEGMFLLIDPNGQVLDQVDYTPGIFLYSLGGQLPIENGYQIVFEDGIERSVFLIE